MFRVTIPRLSRAMPGLRSFSSAPYLKADIAATVPKPRPLRPPPRTNFRSFDKGDSTLPEKIPTFNSPADAITYLNSLSNAKRTKASLQIRPAMEIFHTYIKNHENIDRHSLKLYTALLRVFTEFPVNETSKILLEIYADVKQFVTKPDELQNLQTKFVNLLCEQHSRIQNRLEKVNDRSTNERVENLQSEIDSALLEIITNPNPMFRLSVESHDLVLGALAARANTEKVNEIFALMAMNKIIPSSDTFSHLVYANGKKDLEAANTWFNRYRSAPIVKTSKPYFAFASVLLENGYFNEAWELLNVTMLGDGIPFGVDALNFILGELSKNGFYEEAKTRYKQVVNEETGDLRAKLKTHMVMLRGAINNNDLDVASSILIQNKNITAIPNVGQLFSMSVEKDALDFALELAKRAIEVEPETLHRLMSKLCKADQDEKMIEYLRQRQNYLDYKTLTVAISVVKPSYFNIIRILRLTSFSRPFINTIAYKAWEVYMTDVMNGSKPALNFSETDYKLIIQQCFTNIPTKSDIRTSFFVNHLPNRLEQVCNYYMHINQVPMPDSLRLHIKNCYQTIVREEDAIEPWVERSKDIFGNDVNEHLPPLPPTELTKLSNDLLAKTTEGNAMEVRKILGTLYRHRQPPSITVLQRAMESISTETLKVVAPTLLDLIKTYPPAECKTLIAMYLNLMVQSRVQYPVLKIWKYLTKLGGADLLTPAMISNGVFMALPDTRQGFRQLWEFYTFIRDTITTDQNSLIKRLDSRAGNGLLGKFCEMYAVRTTPDGKEEPYAVAFFNDMKKLRPDFEFTALTLAHYIIYLANVPGETEFVPSKSEFLDLGDKMLDFVKENQTAVNSAIAASVCGIIKFHGDISTAFNVTKEAVRSGLPLNSEVYCMLMVGLFDKGLYDQVKEVFTTCQGKFSDEEMMALYKVGKDRSDRSCYEIAIEAMLKTRKEQDVLYAKNVAIEAYHRNCVVPRWLLKDISIALAEKGATGDAKNFVELFNPSLEFPLIAIPQVAKALIVSILDHGILPAKTEFEKFMNGIQKYIDQLPRIFTDLESVSDQVREIGKLIIAQAEAEDRQSIAKEVEMTMENFINAVEAYKQQLKEKLMMEIEERKEKFKKEMEQEMSNLEDEAGLEGETLRY